jgi:hypothetical protein
VSKHHSAFQYTILPYCKTEVEGKTKIKFCVYRSEKFYKNENVYAIWKLFSLIIQIATWNVSSLFFVLLYEEPRRIACVNLARRVAEEKSCQLGHEVGYAIRFEDCFRENITRIKYITDGFLIREMMQNPLLPQYSVIVLDEVHERNVNTDIIIGL